MPEELKVLANQRDVPYQSLRKVLRAERLVVERARGRRARGGVADAAVVLSLDVRSAARVSRNVPLLNEPS